MQNPRSIVCAACALLLAACTSGPAATGPAPGTGAPIAVVEPARTLTIAMRDEPSALPFRALTFGGGSPSAQGFLFHAGLALADERGVPQPQLAADLPQLNTDSWQLLPDGRMQTTYHLRPGLVWHDGTPLTAGDFVLGWHVYSTPGFGAEDRPLTFMDGVTAPDDQTVVIHWKQSFPDAGATLYERHGFAPLPQHILARPFAEQSSDSFAANPWWTTAFVGLGPYRLVHWEPGAYIEGAAFEGYVFGRPHIDRVKLVWISDANTAVTHLLSGTVDFATDDAIGFEQSLLLKREWGDQGGKLLLTPSQTQMMQAQFRPEYTLPALNDPRVRQAILTATDRQAVVEGVLNGEPAVADTLVSTQLEFYPALAQVLTTYPYDPAHAGELMRAAGLTKDATGFYADSSGAHFSPELWAVAAAPSDKIAAIVTDSWRRAGIDATQRLITPAQFQDRELNTTFRGYRLVAKQAQGDSAFTAFASSYIGTAANRWMGTNYGGYSNREFDRLTQLYQTSLDRAEHNQAGVAGMQLLSQEVPGFALYYSYRVSAEGAGLTGPRAGTQEAWNIHEWQWTR
ncbi:MAG: peptide/nickel transport system substrate-binding protein [Chloroflexota bacterium]|jgi:peptide/nickel transport system substrate-binding protein|nr:peptide/nickel transport system substrate-binding protein [Chloroflexota bacterium]